MARVVIVGGGPSGLMAAEVLASAGHAVTVYEAMPTVGRKFLLAGKSGLNITHSEDHTRFLSRFQPSGDRLWPAVEAFPAAAVRAFALALGTETFIGSSGRVFPTVMKASPLLRAWLRRLEGQGVEILTRHRWTGFVDGGLRFDTPQGTKVVEADASLLALGGASWPRLGSDAAWVPWLRERGVDVADLRPANCGFDVAWSDLFRERFSGVPVKSVTAATDAGPIHGDFVVTQNGIEGSLVYAHAASLRDRLETEGVASLLLDLMPGRTLARLTQDLSKQGGKASLATLLRKGAGIDGVKAALLREFSSETERRDPQKLSRMIKAFALPVVRPRPIAEAISSAGGIGWGAIDDGYMLRALPGVFVAGEMIDWEAPTGGYLLTACFATGRASADGIARWLAR
ncbi:NAD(FAD)-utilizing dehydrogenase [Rhizobium sp. 58]|nr:NAD(FAD)-utilizing dehydrogenase [Rhizobium sp. 58]